MPWAIDELTWIGADDLASEGDIITVIVSTPIGIVNVMAKVDIERDPGTGRIRVNLTGAHIHSDAGANAIGIGNLRVLADFILRKVDCDEARDEGASRTSGANPDHFPRALRFTRRGDPPHGA